MRTARRLPPIAVALALALAALVAGCGGDSGSDGGAYDGDGESTAAQEAERSERAAPPGATATECEPIAAAEVADLKATGAGCGEAAAVAQEWTGEDACRPPAGASRGSCEVRDMRCLSAATDRGLAVSCAEPGRSVAFTVG